MIDEVIKVNDEPDGELINPKVFVDGREVSDDLGYLIDMDDLSVILDEREIAILDGLRYNYNLKPILDGLRSNANIDSVKISKKQLFDILKTYFHDQDKTISQFENEIEIKHDAVCRLEHKLNRKRINRSNLTIHLGALGTAFKFKEEFERLNSEEEDYKIEIKELELTKSSLIRQAREYRRKAEDEELLFSKIDKSLDERITAIKKQASEETAVNASELPTKRKSRWLYAAAGAMALFTTFTGAYLLENKGLDVKGMLSRLNPNSKITSTYEQENRTNFSLDSLDSILAVEEQNKSNDDAGQEETKAVDELIIEPVSKINEEKKTGIDSAIEENTAQETDTNPAAAQINSLKIKSVNGWGFSHYALVNKGHYTLEELIGKKTKQVAEYYTNLPSDKRKELSAETRRLHELNKNNQGFNANNLNYIPLDAAIDMGDYGADDNLFSTYASMIVGQPKGVLIASGDTGAKESTAETKLGDDKEREPTMPKKAVEEKRDEKKIASDDSSRKELNSEYNNCLGRNKGKEAEPFFRGELCTYFITSDPDNMRNYGAAYHKLRDAISSYYFNTSRNDGSLEKGISEALDSLVLNSKVSGELGIRGIDRSGKIKTIKIISGVSAEQRKKVPGAWTTKDNEAKLRKQWNGILSALQKDITTYLTWMHDKETLLTSDEIYDLSRAFSNYRAEKGLLLDDEYTAKTELSLEQIN